MKQIGLVILAVAGLVVSGCAGSEASDSMFGNDTSATDGSGGAGGEGGGGGGETGTTSSKSTSTSGSTSTSTGTSTTTSTSTSTSTWTSTSTTTSTATTTNTWSSTGTTTGTLPDCDPMDIMCMMECLQGSAVCAASQCNCTGGLGGLDGGLPFP